MGNLNGLKWNFDGISLFLEALKGFSHISYIELETLNAIVDLSYLLAAKNLSDGGVILSVQKTLK